jgi:hypothetical protein
MFLCGAVTGLTGQITMVAVFFDFRLLLVTLSADLRPGIPDFLGRFPLYGINTKPIITVTTFTACSGSLFKKSFMPSLRFYYSVPI